MMLDCTRKEEQLAAMAGMRSATVVLSAMSLNVVPVELDWNTAVAITPPGLEVLSGRPYWARFVIREVKDEEDGTHFL